jgi:UDP-N-acetylmuramoyl-L-alanyl-D-glutamate--2,6-diaminopimelate ligase
MKEFLKTLIPPDILNIYYRAWGAVGALLFLYPSHKLFVVGVTGTKGKSTTVELIRSVFEGAGLKTAAASTIRFTIGGQSERNLFKMTMPGRFFLQQFLRKARAQGCTHAVIEMTSEGARQFRHQGLALDALVFTNLQPEHLESHGGMEAYAAAKLVLAKHLEESSKRPRYIVANIEDSYGKKFLEVNVEHKAPFSLKDAEPYNTDGKSVRFVYKGKELFTVPLPGVFNIKNILATLALGEAIGLPLATMRRTLERQKPIEGRQERIEKGQPFAVVVDNAHTPDSLKALCEAYGGKRLVGVLGSMGGGRDKWKRPLMGKIADEHCAVAILTNEDPCDEDPQAIINDLSRGFIHKKPRVILDRRAAIREALREAKPGDAVLITGKGTDPYIMGPKGTKQEWSDKKVAEEELVKLGYKLVSK